METGGHGDSGGDPDEPISDLAERRWGPNRGPLPHADLGWLWLKMVFIVSAPRVITGLSWCR